MKRVAKSSTDKKVARKTNKKVVRMNDPIRIVPLHLPSELYRPSAGIAAAPAAQLTYRGGPLLDSVRVFTIFSGQAWQTSPNSDLANQLNQFFGFVVSSSLVDQLAEYSVPGHTIGHGSYIGTAAITQPTLSHSVTDAAIQNMLEQEIKSNSSVPKPDVNTLYFIYLPLGGMTNLDALTSTSLHELCEAITDPVPGWGWYDDTHGEIGDICAWQTKKLGSYMVQMEWSNKDANCK